MLSVIATKLFQAKKPSFSLDRTPPFCTKAFDGFVTIFYLVSSDRDTLLML